MTNQNKPLLAVVFLVTLFGFAYWLSARQTTVYSFRSQLSTELEFKLAIRTSADATKYYLPRDYLEYFEEGLKIEASNGFDVNVDEIRFNQSTISWEGDKSGKRTNFSIKGLQLNVPIKLSKPDSATAGQTRVVGILSEAMLDVVGSETLMIQHDPTTAPIAVRHPPRKFTIKTFEFQTLGAYIARIAVQWAISLALASLVTALATQFKSE